MSGSIRKWKKSEPLGSTIDQHLEILNKIIGYTPGIYTVLKWHPKTCTVCELKYFPSGSNEQKCWVCAKKHRQKIRAKWYPEYIKLYMREYRKKRHGK